MKKHITQIKERNSSFIPSQEQSNIRAMQNIWSTTLTLVYPVLALLCPVLIVMMKIRVVFSCDWFVKTQKVIMAMGESAWEATPQLTLQLYIVLTTIDQDLQLIQIMVIASSALTLPIPAIELYLQSNGKEESLKSILFYFPLFFFATVFRIMSVSIMLRKVLK